MLKLLKFFRPYIAYIILIFILLYIQAMTDLALPDIMSRIVNNGIALSSSGNDQSQYIWQQGSLMLSYALIGAICSIVVGLLAARTAAGLGKNMRSSVFQRVTAFSSQEFDKFSTASLITRSTNDIQQIQHMTVMMLRIFFYAPILGIGGILKIIRQHSTMAWIIAVAVFLLLTLVLALFFIAMPRFKRLQKLVDRLNQVTREMLTGLLVIRAFNTNRLEEEKFGRANQDLTRTHLFVNRMMAFMMPAMMLIMNGITILIVWVGSHQIDAGQLMVGDMMAFIQYAMQIIMAFLMVSMAFIMLPRASVSAGRISEILDTEPTISDPIKPASLPESAKGRLSFNNVFFKYPGAEEDVLSSLDFEISPGSTTALIGSTGSGKSTIANLIMRFYDVTSGSIMLDGADIRKLSQKDLRARVGFVPQKAVLFSGTIRSNLSYGSQNTSEDNLIKSAVIAQASEFIDDIEDGIDHEVAQSGANFSGGQKQRLAIARALTKNAPLLVFDDSFSALDYKTDARLRQALKREIGEKSIFIITQRVATIKNADQILVLDQGRLVGKGTHQDLLKVCQVYQEIAASQLSQEELES